MSSKAFDIIVQMGKTDKSSEKSLNFFKFFAGNDWLVVLLVLGAFGVYAYADYLDSSIAVGYGLLSKQFKSTPFEAIAALLLYLTLREARKTRAEAVRQTDLTLRPYLRISWDTTQLPESRVPQGMTDTCVVVSNVGNGLMRSLNYQDVSVSGKSVQVRNHPSLIAGEKQSVVCDTDGVILGSRNDPNRQSENDSIARKEAIVVKGTYRDVEGRQYGFCFVSDQTQESWFKEKGKQNLVKKYI
jgi:hypothetical protein